MHPNALRCITKEKLTLFGSNEVSRNSLAIVSITLLRCVVLLQYSVLKSRCIALQFFTGAVVMVSLLREKCSLSGRGRNDRVMITHFYVVQ